MLPRDLLGARPRGFEVPPERPLRSLLRTRTLACRGFEFGPRGLEFEERLVLLLRWRDCERFAVCERELCEPFREDRTELLRLLRADANDLLDRCEDDRTVERDFGLEFERCVDCLRALLVTASRQ